MIYNIYITFIYVTSFKGPLKSRQRAVNPSLGGVETVYACVAFIWVHLYTFTSLYGYMF